MDSDTGENSNCIRKCMKEEKKDNNNRTNDGMPLIIWYYFIQTEQGPLHSAANSPSMMITCKVISAANSVIMEVLRKYIK
jgi:hypothetical protein